MHSICVFCGSNAGSGEVYADAARALARAIAGRGMQLVYGGGNIGLMGVLAEAALAVGGRVTGVTPRRLLESEHRDMVLVGNDPEALIARLRSYRLPEVSKWIGRGQI